MKRIKMIVLFALLPLLGLKAQSIVENPLSIGEVVEIDSKILSEKRRLNIYIPNDEKERQFDVIYLLDGSMNEDFIHIVGLVQFFNLMFQMPPTIVVGIKNIDRKRDFTFHTDNAELLEKFPTTGGSKAFIDFVETELLPFIGNKYKVTKKRTLIGQSLGGLLATEILLKKPELFSDYFIVSPSLWWDNESMFDNIENLISKHNEAKVNVFISVGSEGRIMEREAKGLYKKLRKSNLKNAKLYYKKLKDENHATVLHNAIYNILKSVYPYKE